MNTSVHIPEDLAIRLKEHLASNEQSVSKNAVIVEALREYLARKQSEVTWSDRFLEWQGHPELEIDRHDFDWKSTDVFT